MSCRKWPSSASRDSRRAATCSRGSIFPRQTSGRTSSIPSTSSSGPSTEGTSRRVSRDSLACKCDSTADHSNTDLCIRFHASCTTFLIYSAKKRFENDPQRSKTVKSPWPPWRLPAPVDEGMEDPRKILHSSELIHAGRSRIPLRMCITSILSIFRIHPWPLVQSLVQGRSRHHDKVRL